MFCFFLDSCNDISELVQEGDFGLGFQTQVIFLLIGFLTILSSSVIFVMFLFSYILYSILTMMFLGEIQF